jgi:hypothetical protein
VSEKEQVEAVKLLQKWLAAARGAAANANPDGSQRADLLTELITETESFLRLGEPESHGQRRS